MRMWMVNPVFMCRSHLLGEHVEVHMFASSIDSKCSVDGYLSKGLLEIHSLYCRHQELAEEMEKRGYKHKSPLGEKWRYVEEAGKIDVKKSQQELVARCLKCRARYLGLPLQK